LLKRLLQNGAMCEARLEVGRSRFVHSSSHFCGIVPRVFRFSQRESLRRM
jgi:hypothetical protein